MNSSNIVTPHNNTCSRVLLQQLRLCPAFPGKEEFREERLRQQNRRVTAAEVQINPPAAEGGLEPPHRSRAQDCLGFVPGSLGFPVKGMKISWGEKMFSLCLQPFIAASSPPHAAPGALRSGSGQSGDTAAAPLLWRGNGAAKEKIQLERRFRREGRAVEPAACLGRKADTSSPASPAAALGSHIPGTPGGSVGCTAMLPRDPH